MVEIATLVGCAIGDALGNPFEMKAATSPSLKEWDGLFKAGGTFWQGQPGQYTDDTLMSIALAGSLIENDEFVPEHVAQMYLEWYNSGNTRGIGNTTAGSMVKLRLGAPWQQSGITADHTGRSVGGNGTAMRAAPIGLFYRHDIEQLIRSAYTDVSITHNALEPKMGSIAVALGTALLANQSDSIYPPIIPILANIIEVLDDCVVKDALLKTINHLIDQTDPMIALADIGITGNMGYVPETVASAFYCLGATDNFRDCVVLSIKCGGDTDTTAAVAGALAGTWYGLEGIPSEYHSVENFQLLKALTQKLVNNGI